MACERSLQMLGGRSILRVVDQDRTPAVMRTRMVGRKREADFQWRRALSFGPADDLDMDASASAFANEVLASERWWRA